MCFFKQKTAYEMRISDWSSDVCSSDLFIAFLLTQSSSMLAESVHSVADSGNQLLLLLGGRRARRLPDEEHPFGYGRARYFYRSEGRRVGTECGRTCSTRWAQSH